MFFLLCQEDCSCLLKIEKKWREKLLCFMLELEIYFRESQFKYIYSNTMAPITKHTVVQWTHFQRIYLKNIFRMMWRNNSLRKKQNNIDVSGADTGFLPWGGDLFQSSLDNNLWGGAEFCIQQRSTRIVCLPIFEKHFILVLHCIYIIYLQV